MHTLRFAAPGDKRMRKFTAAFLPLIIATQVAWGNTTVHYSGIARNGGQVAYVENHTVEYGDSGRLVTAVTQYVSESGKPLAEMRSDFRDSLTVPAHTIRDFRTGNVQGLRRENGKVILFDRDAGKPERVRILEDSDGDNRILVGCQGFNYYLLDNLERLKPDQVLPLRFLIPGKLDYYDFQITRVSESGNGITEFEIAIRNWFLKLFAPKLIVRYDRNLKHIVWYEGISNIRNNDGHNQSVTIAYTYEQK
jgi:hypothetical protein